MSVKKSKKSKPRKRAPKPPAIVYAEPVVEEGQNLWLTVTAAVIVLLGAALAIHCHHPVAVQ